MKPEILEIANSFGVWIMVTFIVVLVVIQSILYTKLAYKTADKIGVPKKDCDKALKVGMVTAIGPSVAIFIVMVGLMAVIGGPLAWMRLSIIGAAPTELTAATVGAEAAGVTFGGPDYDLNALATSWWTMAVNGCGWLLLVGLFTPKLEVIREKVSKNDTTWLGVLSGAATLGTFGYLNSGSVVEGGSVLVSVIVGAIAMIILGVATDKSPKLKPLKEYALGIAMLAGVICATVIG